MVADSGVLFCREPRGGCRSGRELVVGVDVVDDYGDVVVLGRLESGTWVRWRVGRRRLAWRPWGEPIRLLEFAQEPFTLFVAVPVLVWFLLAGIAFVVTGAVVWPVRALTGRWLVVARQLDGDEHEPRSAWALGRDVSNELIRRWCRDIEVHGRPVAAPPTCPG